MISYNVKLTSTLHLHTHYMTYDTRQRTALLFITLECCIAHHHTHLHPAAPQHTQILYTVVLGSKLFTSTLRREVCNAMGYRLFHVWVWLNYIKTRCNTPHNIVCQYITLQHIAPDCTKQSLTASFDNMIHLAGQHHSTQLHVSLYYDAKQWAKLHCSENHKLHHITLRQSPCADAWILHEIWYVTPHSIPLRSSGMLHRTSPYQPWPYCTMVHYATPQNIAMNWAALKRIVKKGGALRGAVVSNCVG